jgi:serine/threonine-protein kinase
MAPEQLRGEPVTARSDLYALGLVLYEILAGRRLFDADMLPDVIHQRDRIDAGRVVADTQGNAAVKRVIARCLELRPEDRPSSIHAVIAALPTGDPLQAALDAGETPSPELVASAEGSGELKPAAAAVCLMAYLALVFSMALFAARMGHVPGFIDVPEGPETLATRASDILRQAGAGGGPGDRVYRWDFDWDRRGWMLEHGVEWRARGRTVAPSPVFLWYRYSPEPMDAMDERQRISERDPPLDRPGMARVRLDAQARLLALTVVPPDRPGGGGDPDWSRLLEATRLDPTSVVEVEPEWVPPVGATSRRAWTGWYAGQSDIPIRVEAAAGGGRTVWLEVIPPWLRPADEAGRPRELFERVWEVLDAALAPLALLTVVAVVLARGNVRRGRGDRRGAMRVGLVIGLARLAFDAARADFRPPDMLDHTIRLLASAAFQGLIAWLAYLAVEPYLRRTWPRVMIGWHRLLAARLKDARVGREVLLGLLAGALLTVSLELLATIMIQDVPYAAPLDRLARFRDQASDIPRYVWLAGRTTLAVGLVLLVSTLLFRRRSLTIAVVWVVVALIGADEIFDIGFLLALMVVEGTVLTVTLVRVGLLGFAAAWFASRLVMTPLTLDPSRWYFVHSVVPLLVLVGLGIWAAWRALGEQPALGRFLAEEPPPAMR